MKNILMVFALLLATSGAQASQVGVAIEGVRLSHAAMVSIIQNHQSCSVLAVEATRDAVISSLKVSGVAVPERVGVTDVTSPFAGYFLVTFDLSEIPNVVPQMMFDVKVEKQGDTCIVSGTPSRVVNGGYSVHN